MKTFLKEENKFLILFPSLSYVKITKIIITLFIILKTKFTLIYSESVSQPVYEMLYKQNCWPKFVGHNIFLSIIKFDSLVLVKKT